MNNVLISCVGKRSDLVTSFKESLSNKGKLIAVDVNDKSTGLQYADKSYVSPLFSSKNYIDWMLDICIKESIQFIISFNVSDLLILTNNKSKFEEINCKVISGTSDSIMKTYDKYKLYLMCRENSLPYVQTILAEDFIIDGKNKFPLIIKPRFGSGSRGVMIVKNLNDFHLALKEIKNVKTEFIIQEFIEGQEFGLDVVNDLQGDFQALYVRSKIEMKNGETHAAITESPEEWESYAQSISSILGHEGTIDMDVITHKGSKYLIDINYRFGGGYIFNQIAGANTPKAYVSWMQNENAEKSCFNYEIGVKRIRDEYGNISK